MKDTVILGMMSGTSLDGLDLALCRFTEEKNIGFELLDALTVSYSDEWQQRLSHAMELGGSDLMQLNADLGIWMGQQASRFLSENKHTCHAIGSHGHTIFHRPELGFSTQIGSGAHIAVHSGHTTICDFRSTDIALGGQGAPLVPIGDELLFSEYDLCLNLGGIANISGKLGDQRIAFDISPANMALNEIARRKGKSYDPQGEMAASGKVDQELLGQLNTLDFYYRHAPKSLGREWYEQQFLPLISASKGSPEDLLATLCEHIAMQISRASSPFQANTMLITGGGAHNSHLIDRIHNHSGLKLILPSPRIIDFKEAIIFAFLAWLRLGNMPNALASVTGARRNSIGGAIYLH